MAWSTRQLADLAGTTVKAVRHYHRVGLLDEPERASNGYKQYRTAHLVRLLQIKRLSGLGVPLSQITAMGRAGEDPDEAIRLLDVELAATIERLQRIRAELGAILRHRAPIDVPARFGPVDQHLSDTDRALITVYSQVFNEKAMDSVRDMVSSPDPLDREFESLPSDADDAMIRALAEHMAPAIQAMRVRHAWTVDPATRQTRGASADDVMGQAMADLYSPAQISVPQHVNRSAVGLRPCGRTRLWVLPASARNHARAGLAEGQEASVWWCGLANSTTRRLRDGQERLPRS